jgi:hypothetical protein
VPVLGEFFGSDGGLSASVITWLSEGCRRSRGPSSNRSLSEGNDVYCWADGVHYPRPGRPPPRAQPDARLLVVVRLPLPGAEASHLAVTASWAGGLLVYRPPHCQ